jgi:hypothetical protein
MIRQSLNYPTNQLAGSLHSRLITMSAINEEERVSSNWKACNDLAWTENWFAEPSDCEANVRFLHPC